MRPWIQILRQLSWLTQLGLSIIAPLVLCVAGCWWLQERFSLGVWIMAVGFVLGIGASLSSAVGFYRYVKRKSGQNQQRRQDAFNSHH